MENLSAFRHRSPQQVFTHHGKAGDRRDVVAYVSDFAQDSILMTPDRVYKGRDGVRKWITEFWKKLDDGKFSALYVKRTGCAIFVRYICKARNYCIHDGVATFIVSNGYFSVLTNHYTLTPSHRRNKTKKALRQKSPTVLPQSIGGVNP